MKWRQGTNGKGDISPHMGSIVSRNVCVCVCVCWGEGRRTNIRRGYGTSEGLVAPHGEEVPFGRGGPRGALVHALGAGALVLLFGARAGRDGGRGRGGGAGLLLKVCDDHRHVAHGDRQLLGGAPVDVLQLGPEGTHTHTHRQTSTRRHAQRSAMSRLYIKRAWALSVKDHL